MATNSIYKFVLDLCRGVLLEPEHLLRGDRTCTNHQRHIRRRVVEVHIIVDIPRRSMASSCESPSFSTPCLYVPRITVLRISTSRERLFTRLNLHPCVSDALVPLAHRAVHKLVCFVQRLVPERPAKRRLALRVKERHAVRRMKTMQVLRAPKEHDGHPHLLAEVRNALLSLQEFLKRNKLDLFENLGESFLAAGGKLLFLHFIFQTSLVFCLF